MYTKEQVDEMLLQVEQEFEKTLGSISKSEKNQTTEESADADSEEFETIDELYASMSKNEIDAHYSSIKKVMLAKSEDEDCEMEKEEHEMEEEKEEHEKKEKKEDEEKEEHEKKEDEKEMEKCGEMPAAKKSETSSLVQENEELKKNIETLNDLVSKLFSKKAPSQKAITATSFIAKSEETEQASFDISEMSKGEITSKLKALNFGSLSKSDRDAINNFYLQNGSVEKIKHLISK